LKRRIEEEGKRGGGRTREKEREEVRDSVCDIDGYRY
jgi:hypothetical protein